MDASSFPPGMIGTLGLLVSIAFYAAVSLSASRPTFTSYDFLHVDAKSSKTRAAISIACANITLGTGLAYLVGQAKISGAYALTIPIGVLIGYVLVSIYIKRVPFSPSVNLPNLVSLLQENHPNFHASFTIAMVPTYLFIIAIELYTSSTIISSILFPSMGRGIVVGLAVGFLFIVLCYTVVGGQRSSIATDQWQFPVVLIFVIALAGTMLAIKIGFIRWNGATEAAKPPIVSGWAPLVFGVLAAITTQFYDIANISVGSNFFSKDQARIFMRAGLIISAVLALFVAAGILVRNDLADNPLLGLFEPLSVPSLASYILTPLVVVGCVAILFSSIDSVLVATTQIVMENGARLVLPESRVQGLRTWHARLAMSVIALLMCGGLVKLFSATPDFVPMLLSTAYALTALAPMMAALIWLVANGKTSFLRNPRVILCYILTVVAFWVFSALDLDVHQKGEVQVVSLLSMIVVCGCGIVFGRGETR